MAFNPNQRDLAACLEDIRAIQKEHGIDPKKIVTSRDPVVAKLAYTKLAVQNVPPGFTKTMLPVFMPRESTLYISAGAPGTKVPSHSHDEGDGIRFMISGSIHYGDRELTEGDWMFIPAGVPYEFEVGPRGAVMCYCYSCCCA
jgi:hypothetical protein